MASQSKVWEQIRPGKVPLLNIPKQEAGLRQELEAAIARVLDHGQYILGPEVQELEVRFAEYCGSRFAVSCASGSDAILLPLMALGTGEGDEVITCPFTFFATAGAIARLGARTTFVDIERETFNMDPAALAKNLESRSPDELRRVKAIMPIHLFGQCADMEAIRRVSDRFGIPVIEDAAQAVGAEQNGQRAGRLGWTAGFSFFPTKNLGCAGDGGMMTTDDPQTAKALKMLRMHGSEVRYYHQKVGMNSRLDTLQAAVLLVKLKHLDVWNEQRRANAAIYGWALEPFQDQVTLPKEAAGMRHVFNQYTVRVRNRDAVRTYLTGAGVGSEVYYPVPLHLQECFAHLGYRVGDFPESEAAAKEVLSLPIHPALAPEEVETVAGHLIRSFTEV